MFSKLTLSTFRIGFLVLLMSIVVGSIVWGPAAFAQSDDDVPTPDEIENMADPGSLPSTDEDAPVVRKKLQKRPVAKPKAKLKAKSKLRAKPKPVVEESEAEEPVVKKPKKKRKQKVVEPAADAEAEADTEEPNAPESIVTEERDPVRRSSNARELAIRVVGLGKISVTKIARKYVPKDTEVRLAERLVQELAAKTYFEPQAMDGNFDLKTRAGVLAAASKKAMTDGILVFEIGLEEIKGYLASSSGRRIRTFEFKYRVGEMDEKNAVSILANRLIEGLVQAIPYRGFVTAVDKGNATINLGSNHSIKEGDVLELFEFRRPVFSSTQRFLVNVVVKKVDGPSESQVAVVEGTVKTARIEPFAKVSFKVVNKPSPMVAATDKSVVNGRWWFGFGGELNTLGAVAAAEKYETKVFKVNNAPFGYAAGGNDLLTFRAAFGSASSENETLAFFDGQGTYAIYQLGSAQSAWTISAGGRVFMIRVTPLPGVLSSLETTTIVSPMAEFKYQYVPRGRIRLVGTGEVFWPIYTNGASVSALPFAFGAGAGGGLQLAITPKFGFEVFGKIRYLRRLIDGQSGIQERQTMLGTGLLFSF